MISHSNYLFVLPSSPFSLLRTLSFFSIILGVFFSLKISFHLLIVSLFRGVFSGVLWWFFYSLELSESGEIRINIIKGLKFSFLLFIFSEVFFFFSFFWRYFHFYLRPLRELGMSWPPLSIVMFNFIEIPLLNTLILLGSGISVTCSHFFFFYGNLKLSSIYLFFTFFLGLIFSFFQVLEYSRSFFSFNDSCFGSCFFTLTGFHGMHVLIGSLYLIFVFFRLNFNPPFFSLAPLSFELARWYWHFVDVVWIILYFFVYAYSCSS